jgi:tripartite tricarboxylate transporter TctB family protein
VAWQVTRRFPALTLVGLGLAALTEAWGLSFGTVRQPGSGFYPTLVCLALIVFGVLSLGAEGPASSSSAAEARGHARVWLVVGAVAAYVWALVPVGFVLCTAALLLLLLRVTGRILRLTSVAAAALGAVACYVLFTRLGMPLPAGLLGF